MKYFRPKPLHNDIEILGSVDFVLRWTEGGVLAYIRKLSLSDLKNLADLVYEDINNYPVNGLERGVRWGEMSAKNIIEWMACFLYWDIQDQVLVSVSAEELQTRKITTLVNFIKG